MHLDLRGVAGDDLNQIGCAGKINHAMASNWSLRAA
jgi:hypothetical protein